MDARRNTLLNTYARRGVGGHRPAARARIRTTIPPNAARPWNADTAPPSPPRGMERGGLAHELGPDPRDEQAVEQARGTPCPSQLLYNKHSVIRTRCI